MLMFVTESVPGATEYLIVLREDDLAVMASVFLLFEHRIILSIVERLLFFFFLFFSFPRVKGNRVGLCLCLRTNSLRYC